jgi:phospholipase/carboxylesterase
VSDLGYVHRFIAATRPGKPPLLLLHRTGGNENDLVNFGRRAAPGAALLALRGNVLEDGKPRFFRRVARGEFDLDDFKLRTRELGDFIARARAAYGIEAPIVAGFSNGANIAWSLLLGAPGLLKGAILMRPMLAFDPRPVTSVGGLPVLVIAGAHDAIIARENRDAMPALLREAGAQVTYETVPGDHNLMVADGDVAAAWLDKLQV